jgi:hypothetical protein
MRTCQVAQGDCDVDQREPKTILHAAARIAHFELGEDSSPEFFRLDSRHSRRLRRLLLSLAVDHLARLAQFEQG